MLALTQLAVILLGLPQLAGDLIAEIVRDQTDLRLIGRAADPEDARRLASTAAERVAIVAGDLPRSELTALLFALPGSRVIVVQRDGRGGRSCELETRCRELTGASPAELLAAVRAAPHAEAALP
jgi:hypothetical protein